MKRPSSVNIFALQVSIGILANQQVFQQKFDEKTKRWEIQNKKRYFLINLH